jgi:putative FmdB family regulatory protein
MPVYEYQCKACHKEFEYQQRMADPDKTVCEACGGELERLISRTAFQLKGSGWYKDLYSSSKPAESSESKPAETKTETKTETAKPADSGGSSTSTSPSTSTNTSSDSGGSGGTSKAAASQA